MKKTSFLATLCLIPLVLSACTNANAASASATPTPAPTPVVQSGVDAFGTLKVTRIVDVTLPVQAIVTDMKVRDGMKISTGDVIALLDTRDAALQLTQKQIDLQGAQREYNRASSARAGKTADVTRLVKDIENAKTQLSTAETDLADKKKQWEAGIILEKEVKDQQQVVDTRRKAVSDAELALSAAQATNSDTAGARQDSIRRLQTEMSLLNERLTTGSLKDNSLLNSLPASVVSETVARTGASLPAGSKLCSLLQLDSMIVSADVPEEFIRDVKQGQKVEIKPSADKTKTYTGVVKQITATAMTRNGQTVIPVEISLDKPDAFLLPEFNVDVHILTGK